MKQAAARKTTTNGEKKPSGSVDGMVIALQLLDTSWRVAIPIILFCYLGIQLDRHYHTNPLYSLLGLLVSLVVATLLVYKQVKSLYPDFIKKNGLKHD